METDTHTHTDTLHAGGEVLAAVLPAGAGLIRERGWLSQEDLMEMVMVMDLMMLVHVLVGKVLTAVAGREVLPAGYWIERDRWERWKKLNFALCCMYHVYAKACALLWFTVLPSYGA